MTTPLQHYKQAKNSLSRAVEEELISKRDADAIREFASAYDENDISESKPNGDNHKEYDTLRVYVSNLCRVAKMMDEELVEASVEDINRIINQMLEENKSKNTIRTYQANLRRFYHYHDLDISRTDIQLVSSEDTTVDDRDMLTPEEISRIRDAAEHPRDLCVFDLLLYTGQRNTALRTLRIKDIDITEGIYYLNTEADGLKGADRHSTKRPLLGATGSVRDWLRYHPFPDNRDAYLLTPKPRYADVDPEEPISRETMAYVMDQLKETTGIDKPMNPHSIRHNFVTIAKREYGLDDMHIKRLIGHRKGSDVMETTYAHLSDDDVIEAAEIGAGIREPEKENESSLTPDICQCGEPLSENAKACPSCGTVYTPDAESAQQTVEELALEGMREAEDEEEADAVEDFREFLKDNPEAAVKILREEL